MVRVRRIELRSQVWKTCILAVVLHPRICLLPQCNRGDYITSFVLNVVDNFDFSAETVKSLSKIFVATVNRVYISKH